MNRIQPDKHKWRRRRKHILKHSDFHKALDNLLALDQAVVELSMRIYNVPRRDRVLLRKQNRRLHAVVRERLPRLLRGKWPLTVRAVSR